VEAIGHAGKLSQVNSCDFGRRGSGRARFVLVGYSVTRARSSRCERDTEFALLERIIAKRLSKKATAVIERKGDEGTGRPVLVC
jgi:hypothetical protein